MLGPTLPLDEALVPLRRPALQPRRPPAWSWSASLVDTDVLTRAMHAGARDVVPSNDIDAITRRGRPRLPALRRRCAARAAPTHMGKVISVFSPKGGVGKTTIAVNLALALTDRGRPPGLPGRPRPRLRRRRDHHAAVPVALDRARDRRRGHRSTSRSLDGLLTRHESRPDGPRRAEPARRPRPGHADAGVPDASGRSRRTSTTSSSTRAPAFDEQTLTALDETDELRHGRHPRRAHPQERQGGARDPRHARHRPGPPAPAAQPRRRRGRASAPRRSRRSWACRSSTQIATSIDIAAATNAGRPIVRPPPTTPPAEAVRNLAADAGRATTTPTLGRRVR